MNKFIFFFLCITIILGQNKSIQELQINNSEKSSQIKKLNNKDLEKKFLQAKSMERAGLYKEAQLLFIEINQQYPGQVKYFVPLKNYLKQKEEWEDLLLYAQLFRDARNNDFQSKLEYIDIYIWMENKLMWQEICKGLIDEPTTDSNKIKNLIQRLVNNSKIDYSRELLQEYRKKSKIEDFFSLEMGTILSTRMAYHSAIDEYLLHLKHHPKNIQTVSDHIMAFPDEPDILTVTESVLSESPLKSAHYILADLQYKQRKFDKAYKILKENDVSPKMLLEFGKGLASVNEFEKAEIVLTELLNITANDQILTQAILEIAKIFESKMVITTTELPISGFYSQNQFFASPYIPVDIDSVHTLQFAMEIYDSLLVTKKNAQAAYRLAEVQFRVLGDLDRAYYLYQEANQHGNSESLRIDAGLGMINVFISKGDLQGAKTKTDELIKQNNNILAFQLKASQILFYLGEFDQTDTKLRKIADSMPKDQKEYNDILDVLAVLISFRHHQNEYKEFSKIQLNIQQNKRAEALEKLVLLFDTNEIYIADMCRYQHAWLTFLQSDTDSAKVYLNTIENETIFKELAHIFIGEILDYIDRDVSAAIDKYLEFLDLYPLSIYYDDVRLRLRKLTS